MKRIAFSACLLNEVEADFLRRRPVAPKKGALHLHSVRRHYQYPQIEYKEARQIVVLHAFLFVCLSTW
jgi:hypothetical protein